MKKTLKIMAATALLLAATSVNSRAAITIGGWVVTPVQTVGDVTWTLTSTDLPSGLMVNFYSLADMRIQDNGGDVLSGATYSLDYTITLNDPSLVFTSVLTDSDYVTGSTTVTKTVSTTGSVLLATASSVNGAPSGIQVIAGAPTTLVVSETINVSGNSAITGFANTYTVTAVPEPSTVMAGLLLLIPLGISTMRIVRRNRVAQV